jgi:hypothetical protein
VRLLTCVIPGNRANGVGPSDEIDTGLRTFNPADVADDFVKGVTDLYDIPAWLGQGGYEDYQGLSTYVEVAVGVDGDVVWRHDMSIFGCFERRVFMKIVQPTNVSLLACRHQLAIELERKSP